MQSSEPLLADKPNGPRSRKGERTRARLLVAAKEVFEKSGFLNARVSDIAEKAGLSHGSFYHYFESKEEIFREVAESVEEQLSAPMGDVILDRHSGATPEERIREAIRRHMQSYRDEAPIMGVIEQVYRYDDQVKAARIKRHRRYTEQVARAVAQLQRRGLADPTLEPEIAAMVLGSMTSRFPEMWFVEGRVDCPFEDGVEQLTRMLMNALGIEQVQGPGRRGRRAKATARR
ncbi:MAG TPA: TetR/AcrR family transcriptional regulator [Acidimicrobiales bacterium]|nr:TetR/AcrR family transcriptional regulator [Acidimicrobiales bacterium]